MKFVSVMIFTAALLFYGLFTAYFLWVGNVSLTESYSLSDMKASWINYLLPFSIYKFMSDYLYQ